MLHMCDGRHNNEVQMIRALIATPVLFTIGLIICEVLF